VQAIQSGLFDHLDLWDTNDTDPEMIAVMDNGRLTVLNQAKFTEFINKGEFKEMPDLNYQGYRPPKPVGIPRTEAMAAQPGDEFVMLESAQPVTLSKGFITLGGHTVGVVTLGDGTDEYVTPEQLGHVPAPVSAEEAVPAPEAVAV
jgi:hypothetical protein